MASKIYTERFYEFHANMITFPGFIHVCVAFSVKHAYMQFRNFTVSYLAIYATRAIPSFKAAFHLELLTS